VSEDRAHHAVALLSLHLPMAQSRKDRRSHVQRLRRALVDELGCSVAEVGGQDTWQRVVLGVSIVAGSAAGVTRVVERITPIAERDPEVVVTGFAVRHDRLDADF
jgi:uncharacterized protein